ncbi:MAG: type II secretion system protein [Sedimentisphaerales bacterium]
MRIANSSYVMRDMCHRIRNTQYAIRNTNKAFTLIEVMAALIILAIVSSSVLVVINRCVASAADSALRMRAFEVARENMEKLLASDSVEETVEYGSSDRYPEINWQTVVETFYEPITARMWVRAVCSAEYNDTKDETQMVELTHWLTDVTKEQLVEIMNRQQEQEDQLADQVIETIEEAAEYAEVDVETIQQWVENGMLTTEDGAFIKDNLDLYKMTGGNPSAEEKKLQISSIRQLLQWAQQKSGSAEADGPQDNVDPVTGLTYEELEQMDVSEIFNLLKDKKR